ncbi:MAG: ornithine cyclodeaminase [Comamonadaceae bacterium]|nr:ornithine cyclodeaminase [Comamonadaceae bacterium]
MQIFDASATRAALPFETLIPALRARFAAGCEVPPRHVHELLHPLGEVGVEAAERRMTSLIMPAWIPGRFYGVKIVNIAPGNAQRGLPGLHGSYLLFDARTGVPLAHIDGDQITARRTAAASALAGSYLARADASHLLLVGAGRVARLLPAAYRAVRPIKQVTVWARRADAAQALARELQAEGWQASASTDLQAACAEAHIVSCATLSTEPLVRGTWLAPGSHLDLIGGFTAAMREADDACFQNARVFVDTEEALHKSGDLLVPMQHGVFRADDLRGTLTTLSKGAATGRKSQTERTVFKSVGTALEDLTAAVLVYESA